jgi:hypothetical protein
MTRWFFLLAAGVMASPALAQAREPGPNDVVLGLQLTSRRHSDFGPLGQLEHIQAHELQARRARNVAYIDEEVRVSARRDLWGVSALARSFAVLTATRDSIHLVRHASGRRSAGDEHWQVDAKFSGFVGAGAEIGRDFVLTENIRGSLAASALLVDRWRDHRVSGDAAYTASGGYSFGLRSSELNDRLQFAFFQQSGAPSGTAMLFSGDLRWQQDSYAAGVSFRDAGRVNWPRIPRQQLDLTSRTQQVDADGFVIYRPLLEGVNSQSQASHAAPLRWTAQASWAASPSGKLTALAEHIQGFGMLPRVEWHQKWGNATGLLRWSVHERRLTVGMDWKGLRFQLGADRFGDSMRSREAQLSYSLAL